MAHDVDVALWKDIVDEQDVSIQMVDAQRAAFRDILTVREVKP